MSDGKDKSSYLIIIQKLQNRLPLLILYQIAATGSDSIKKPELLLLTATGEALNLRSCNINEMLQLLLKKGIEQVKKESNRKKEKTPKSKTQS